jgi:hypothetical protein
VAFPLLLLLLLCLPPRSICLDKRRTGSQFHALGCDIATLHQLGVANGLSSVGSDIRLDRGDSLIVHPLRRTALDYGVHGKVLATDAPYDFVSIVTIENRKKQTIISKLRLSVLDHDARSPERHWSPTNRFC